MYKVKAYRVKKDSADIFPLSAKRSWMDKTWQAHAYHCFPVSLTNQLGWGVSFPEDISFIWNGVSSESAENVKILKGGKYATSSRGNATISFHTGIIFRTDENVSLLHTPVPNQPIDGVSPFSAIISSSFFHSEFPCVWQITRPNVEITIKANTPIISIIPIDLSLVQYSEMIFEDESLLKKPDSDMSDYFKVASEINRSGSWSDFYRNATDHYGKIIGKHQLKKIKMSVMDRK